jgi:tRNA A37 threonylcarbamoyltransferase TsaD
LIGLPVFVPRLDLTTDNAAMIGAAALRRLETGHHDDLSMGAEASLPIGA